jgi:hypothetical protein
VSASQFIPVGVLVERRKGTSKWVDFSWRSVGILPAVPVTPPWTKLSGDDNAMVFYAGAANIELYTSDTQNYLYNLQSRRPSLWVRLRAGAGDQPYSVADVTVDPSEGESFTQAGDDLVDAVTMPETIRAALQAFVAAHHVERPFQKRKRDRADPDALSRRPPVRQDRGHE